MTLLLVSYIPEIIITKPATAISSYPISLSIPNLLQVSRNLWQEIYFWDWWVGSNDLLVYRWAELFGWCALTTTSLHFCVYTCLSMFSVVLECLKRKHWWRTCHMKQVYVKKLKLCKSSWNCPICASSHWQWNCRCNNKCHGWRLTMDLWQTKWHWDSFPLSSLVSSVNNIPPWLIILIYHVENRQ